LKTITIIDTFGFFFRSYFALPPLKNSDGFPTGLLSGFINFIDSLPQEHNTDYLVFALDSKGKTFREELYPEYKAHRESPPEDLIKQLPIAIEWIEKMGFAHFAKEGFEADDVIATVTRIAKEQGVRVRIVSHDKDLYQLIDDKRVVLFDSVKKSNVDEEACIHKFGVNPRDFINFQAIVGDSSDNVPGVKGIGQKGASGLINTYHTLEEIYDNITQCGTARIQKLLLENKENAFLSRQLVTMREDLYENLDFESLKFENKNYLEALVDEFEKYEMKQALRKAKNENNPKDSKNKVENPSKTPSILHFEAITLDSNEKINEVIASITTDPIVAFDTETTGLDTRLESLVGFSFAFEDHRAYYVPIAHTYLGVQTQVTLDEALEAIKKLFAFKIVGQNLKFDLSLLYNRYGFEEIVPFADTMIMAWLSDAGSRVGLDVLADKFFGYTMKPFKEMVKKGEDFSSVTIEEATFYAAEDAWMTRLLYFALEKKMTLASLAPLFSEATYVEYPFINTLARMEKLGIKVDIDHLIFLKESLSQKLKSLTQEIYTLSGTEFNIKSTQQLGVVLFQQLGLKGGKKNKTGYSTDEAVLQTLVNQHPVISKLLEYREYQKMLSTYIEPFLKLAKNDTNHRIYTSFIQTGTATGRLSSKEPNLQNIPTRSALGKSVREVFIAKVGYRLVSIDYSQIELRLLAHFSQDAALMEAFRMGQDIHLATSIKLFGKEQATAKRNIAKSVNFGLLYGMGPKKLSEDTGVTMIEAKEMMSAYFASFPTVKHYLEEIQEHVKINGYVKTLLGRRRFFDYESANGMQKAAYMRESVNAVFQGSAADLMKLSMNQIDAIIQKEKLDASMLLQIHDELIFEIKEEKAEEIVKRFVDVMENIYKLNVPLVCSVSIGKNWGELK